MTETQNSKMTWEIKYFDQLSVTELHDLLKIRVDVFVVEQECAYAEIDGKDPLCIHVLGKDNAGKTRATARIAPAGIIYDEVSIGRVAVDKRFRGNGMGKIVMQHSMSFCKENLKAGTVKIAGQLYLQKFYSDLGFTQISEVYLWDGIEHIDMRISIANE